MMKINYIFFTVFGCQKTQKTVFLQLLKIGKTFLYYLQLAKAKGLKVLIFQ